MKNIFIAILIASMGMLSTAKAQLKANQQCAFQAGEELKYQVKYGIFSAANTTLKVTETPTDFQGNEAFHLQAIGGTAGVLSAMYTVRDVYDTYIDKKTFLPYFYKEDIKENSYTRNDKVSFHQEEQKVVSNKGTFATPTKQTFDLVSAFYYARNLDLSKLKVNDKVTINYCLDGKINQLEIIYLGKEIIKTKLGKLNCLKYSPVISPGRIFKKDSKMYLWVTDDDNRIPVAANVEIIVGAIKLELLSAKGLKYALKTAN